MAKKHTIYTKADGLYYYLEQRFINYRNQFPNDAKNYVKFFQQIEDYLNENIHPEVVTGAALNGCGLLNDHGKNHVAMVIQRANLLLRDCIRNMSGYEIFILLVAIHFHDVGNILGRDDHEMRIFEIMNSLETGIQLETPLKIWIAKIAMAHGGKINNSKDTISSLQVTDHLQGIEIRPALIAAILRFADEISDDHTRAARFLQQSNALPPQNVIFHQYSKCLQPAAIDGNTLIFKFDLPLQFAIEKSTKEDKKTAQGYSSIFLYDEIISRLKKCLCELEYCIRYTQGLINLVYIRADIEVHTPNTLYPIYSDSLRFRLSGYPDACRKDIEEMLESAPSATTGEMMKAKIEEKINATH